MLHTTCPLVACALAAGQRRARFAAHFGPFRQRTIDRRYSGILATATLRGPAAQWFPLAVRAAGGPPSALCWLPFGGGYAALPATLRRRSIGYHSGHQWPTALDHPATDPGRWAGFTSC